MSVAQKAKQKKRDDWCGWKRARIRDEAPADTKEPIAKMEIVDVPMTYNTGTADRIAKIPPQFGLDIGYIQALLNAEALLDYHGVFPVATNVIRNDPGADKAFGDKWRMAKRSRPVHLCRPLAISLIEGATEYDAAMLGLTKMIIFLFDTLFEMRTTHYSKMLFDMKLYKDVELDSQEFARSMESYDDVRENIERNGYNIFELTYHSPEVADLLRPLMMLITHNSRDHQHIKVHNWLVLHTGHGGRQQIITHGYLLRVISEVATFIHQAALIPSEVPIGYCSKIPIDIEKDDFEISVCSLIRRESQRMWRNTRRRIRLLRPDDRNFLIKHMTLPNGFPVDWERNEDTFTGKGILPKETQTRLIEFANAHNISNALALTQLTDPSFQDADTNAMRDRYQNLIATTATNRSTGGLPINRHGQAIAPAPEGTKAGRREAKKKNAKLAKKAKKAGAPSCAGCGGVAVGAMGPPPPPPPPPPSGPPGPPYVDDVDSDETDEDIPLLQRPL